MQTEAAYHFVRTRILDGLYQPGQRLQTVNLASEVCVSRASVRDALRQLQTEGLVEIKPRLGARVVAITVTKFRQLCEMRLALESCAAELAAVNHSRSELAEIQLCFEEMERTAAAVEGPITAEQLKRLSKADLRFHLEILQAAHNDLIRSEILRLHILKHLMGGQVRGLAAYNDQLREIPLNQARLKWVIESHRRIFEAIKQRDAEEARKAMHASIKEYIDERMRAVERSQQNREPEEISRDEARFLPYG